MAKTLTGKVSSNAADKTIVITVQTRKTHPIYKKQYTATSKYMAHDENNDCKVGDLVVIAETRPLSARKRYKLEKILERATITKEDLDVLEQTPVLDSDESSSTEREEA